MKYVKRKNSEVKSLRGIIKKITIAIILFAIAELSIICVNSRAVTISDFFDNNIENYYQDIVKELNNYSYTQGEIEYVGDGIEDSPYLIDSVEKLQGIKYDLTKNYKLISDIDLKGVSWEPIGTEKYPFSGVFDGNEYTIKNLNMNVSGTNIGIFSVCDAATIKNVTIENLKFRGNAECVGGLVGKFLNGELIDITAKNIDINAGEGDNVGGIVGMMGREDRKNDVRFANFRIEFAKIKGKNNIGGMFGNITEAVKSGATDTYSDFYLGEIDIEGNNNVGGMAGISYVRVKKVIFESGIVTGNDCVGGLGGFCPYGADMEGYCELKGHVRGHDYVGGVFGKGGQIGKSYFNGTVKGNNYVGGITGYGDSVYKSYSSGLVEGNECVGGISGCGWNHQNSFTSGLIIGNKNVAGISYIDSSTYHFRISKAVSNTYSIARIRCTSTNDDERFPITTILEGDLEGDCNSIYSSFRTGFTWKNGQTIRAIYDVSSSSKMYDKYTYKNRSWDFDTIWDNEQSASSPYIRELPIPDNVYSSYRTYLPYEMPEYCDISIFDDSESSITFLCELYDGSRGITGYDIFVSGKPIYSVDFETKQKERINEKITIDNLNSGGDYKYYMVARDGTEVVAISEIGTFSREEKITSYYSFDIQKMDENGNSISQEGISFEVEKDDEDARMYTTNENGVVQFSNIEAPEDEGSVIYTIREKNAPDGYVLDENEHNVEFIFKKINNEMIVNEIRLDSEDTAILLDAEEFKNNHNLIKFINKKNPCYTFEIQKVDDEGNAIKQKGIVFDIIKNDEEEPQSMSTNANGKVSISNIEMPLRGGIEKYKIVEKSAPDGYRINEEEHEIQLVFEKVDGEMSLTNIVIDKDENIISVVDEQKTNEYVLINFMNKKIKYKEFIVEKIDESDEKIRIPNIQFNVKNEKTQEVKTYQTDEEGKLGIEVEDSGEKINFTISEIVNDTGFNGIGDFVVSAKYDGEKIDLEVEDIYENVEVIDSDGFNNKDKKVVIKNSQKEIEQGAYKIKVVKNAYNDKAVTINDALLNVNVKNEKGVKEEVKIDYTKDDGYITIEKMNGYGNIDIAINEIEAPDNYQLNEDIHLVKLNRNAETKEITICDGLKNIDEKNIEIDNENQIVTIYISNELQQGIFNFVIKKVDENGEVIDDNSTIFEVAPIGNDNIFEYSKNGGSSKVRVVSEGKAYITEVLMPTNEGRYKYYIKEIVEPEGYELDTEQHEFELEFKKNNGIMEISNVRIKEDENVISLNREVSSGQYVEIDFKDKQYENLYLRSDKYKIDDTYLYRVMPYTTIGEFLKNIDTNANKITIKDKKGIEVDIENEKLLVGSKYTIKAEKRDEAIEKTILVIADTNGDGQIGISDVSTINESYVSSTTPDEIDTKIADINGDGEITVLDISRLNRYFVDMIDSLI